MKDETTIIINTKNNETTIKKLILELHRFQIKHRHIKRIIITDSNSKDATIPIIIETIQETQNTTIILLTNPKKTTEAIKNALEQVMTLNTITLPPYFETNLGQITKQIKLLRKSTLIIPNRYHKSTKNRINKTIHYDYNNPNKAFKTNIIRSLWEKQPLKKFLKLNIRTTNAPTHLKKN